MGIIYFHSEIGKFNVAEWNDGTAIYYWLNHSVFGMPDFLKETINMFLEDKYVIVLVTYGVIIFEILLFLSFGMRYARRKYLFIPAIVFHIFIIVFHGIFSFFFSMAAGLIFLLLDVSKNINFSRNEPKNI